MCANTCALLVGLWQPVSVGYAASAAAAGGTDGHQFGGKAAQGAVGQYGGPYAAVYGAQKVNLCSFSI